MSVLIKKFPVNPFPVNCYIIWDEVSKESAIVDPGYYWEEEKNAIKDFIAKNNLKIKFILLTHLHFDHIISLHDANEVTGAEIYAGKDDVEAYSGLRAFKRNSLCV